MAASLSCSAGLPGMLLLLAYIGWKQPPSSAPNAQTTSNRTAIPRRSPHDIHDPLRNDDPLLRCLPLERLSYLIEGQNGSLNLGIRRRPGDGHFGPFTAVDLHRQG